MARILIIDDQEQVRAVYRELLQLSGHEVVEAADGNAGIELYTQNPADLIITDIMMPKKDGFETIQELRQSFTGVKIIAITGEGLHNLPLAYDMGALRIFEKPIDPKQFLKAVEELLNA